MDTYTTIQGDMWDSIAYKVYGSEKYMGILMQSNMELLDIFIFSAGTVLTVPALLPEAETNIPAWRQ
jgi:phage tail protein X